MDYASTLTSASKKAKYNGRSYRKAAISSRQPWDEEDRETGGALIKPSARPSIHNHWLCPFDENKMVRYGIISNLQESGDFCDEQGADEVDNVMSKPVAPIMSPSRRNKNKHRRNSLRANSKLYTDDDTDVLSKSVPTTLPSQLHCSDDSNDEQEPRIEHQFSDNSFYSVGTPNTSNVSRNFSNISTPQTLDSPRILEKNQTSSQSNFSLIPVLFFVVLATVSVSFLNISTVSNISTYDTFKFYTDISGLGAKYNVDENSILQVQTGISTIFEKNDAGSFIFVYNSNSHDFNQSEFNKFVNDVSVAASKYLRNESTPLHYTTVEGNKLNMEEHGELISRYREDLGRTGVMLVRHIEAIPSDLAMAFHYYCDEYNPLVKKSAIFFTLNLAKCPQESENKSSHALIEKCLAKKWSGVPIDSIGPLLTRVVSVVIDVTSVF